MADYHNDRSVVFIVHSNARMGRFLEGILRNGFCVSVFSELPSGSSKLLEGNPPDLVLCHSDCLTSASSTVVETLSRRDPLQLPMIVVTDEPSDVRALADLQQFVVDCIDRSVNPSVLKWKVANWIRIKREVESLRESRDEALCAARRLESRIQMFLHDLKSPTIAAKGLISRLKRMLAGLPTDEKRDQTVLSLAKVCQSMEDFLQDSGRTLVEGPNPTDYQPFSLPQLAVEVIQQHQQALEDRRIAVRLDAIDPTAHVLGRRLRIRQVIDNLLSNAMQHMGKPPHPSIVLAISRNGNYVEARVTDNGVGIAPQYLEKIFESRFQIRTAAGVNGCGLGLAIVKQIVESHKGTVRVESEPGKGSTFCFSLPGFDPQN